MPAETVETDAFVLVNHPPSDSFQRLSVFSAQFGVLTVMQRVGKKAGATALDLFDEATLLLETSNQGRTYFIKEARLQRRHSEIGRTYDALRLASALTAMIARNPVDEDSRPGVAALLQTALYAFGTSDRPDIVYFKSVYRFARDEGYPVKQEWLPTLPASDRTTATTLLGQPLAGQTAEADLVARLSRRLEDYVRANTEIYLD